MAYALFIEGVMNGDKKRADEQINDWATQVEVVELADRRKRDPRAAFEMTPEMKQKTLAAMSAMGEPAPRKPGR